MATYADFTLLTQTYKEIRGHAIQTDILIPKTAVPGTKCPVIINWHGGALFTGHRAFPPFMNAWLPQWATRHSALIVTSDYRLLPNASASEILSDLRSLWSWVHESLPSIIYSHSENKNLSADLNRIVLVGGSAGGYCAIQQALDHPTQISAVLLAYPMIDLQSPFWRDGNGGEKILGQEPGEREWVMEQLASVDRKEVVTGGGFERFPLAMGVIARGFLRGVMCPDGDGKEEKGEVWPMKRIREGAGLPAKVLIIHGKSDSAVPYEGTEAFAKLLREKLPGTQVRDEYFEGKEHGFDHEVTLEDEWMAEGLKWVEDAWVGK